MLSRRLNQKLSFLKMPKSAIFPLARCFASHDEIPYTERQQKLKRPLSPHVTIYKFPIGALTSITNRFTGIGLSLGISGIGIIHLFGGDPVYVLSTLGTITIIGPLSKLVVSFPLVYHYLGGIRHFYWDSSPETLNNEEVEQTSYYLIGSSVALSLIAAIL